MISKALSFVLPLCLAWNASSAQEASIHVTGQFRIVNGAEQIPLGLFGVHATPLTPEMVADWGVESVRTIDQKPTGIPIVPGKDQRVPEGIKDVIECFYDRYQPALMLTNPAWKESLETLARTYATHAKTSDQIHTIEFWNEPYLNWAKKPGVNYDGELYEPGQEGEPMTIKGWDKPLNSLVWSKQLVAVDEVTGKVDYLASSYALPKVWNGELKEGDEYIFRETKRLRIESRPWGKDPNQRSWFSGPQNSEFYRWMLLPFAKALKETNPNVQLVVGWGFHVSQDNWVAWPVLFKPLIDEAIHWIDGIDEHHYGGDTRMVAGTYEVVQAYSVTTHGKKLKFYNTECGGLLDPERPDSVGKPQWTGNTVEAQSAAATYMLRDIIHMLDNCPDKAVARAAHDATANRGIEVAFKFLKDLRGNLVKVESTGAPRVTGIASIEGKSLCVILFNDSPQPKKLSLKVDAPGRSSFVSGIHTTLESGETLVLKSDPINVSGRSYNSEISLRPKGAVRLTFELSEAPNAETSPAVVETQHFAPGILNHVSEGNPVRLEIQIPPEVLNSATGAQLKLVQERWNPGSVVRLNGSELKLAVQNTWTHQQPIDPKLLKPINTLEFESRSKQPFEIDMASIVTSTKRP